MGKLGIVGNMSKEFKDIGVLGTILNLPNLPKFTINYSLLYTNY